MPRRVGCPYLDAVEGLRDGELGPAGAAELEAHLASCSECQAEQLALDRLSVALKKGDADGSVARPEHERLKSALLARCNESLTARAASSASRSGSAAARRSTMTVWQTAAVGVTLVALVAILFPVFFQAREKARYSALQIAGARSPVAPTREIPRAAEADGKTLDRLPNMRTRTWADGHGGSTQDHEESGSGGPPGSYLVTEGRIESGKVFAQAGVASGAAASSPAKANPLSALADSQPDRYLIKDATLTLEVKDARQASRSLVGAVTAARGYVSDTHEAVDGLGQRSVTTKVRVPFTRFDASMQQIETLGKVLEKQITAEDVTEEFVDSQAKLRNLQRTELRLLQHLNQTGRLSDILLVEREVNRVRGEIEQLEGRLRFLEHRIAFSTITLTLSEAPRPQQVVPAQSYSSGKQASDAMRSLVSFLQVVWSAAIWFAIWAVVWVPILLTGWLVYRRLTDPGVY